VDFACVLVSCKRTAVEVVDGVLLQQLPERTTSLSSRAFKSRPADISVGERKLFACTIAAEAARKTHKDTDNFLVTVG
jgi:hypothetical protein